MEKTSQTFTHFILAFCSGLLRWFNSWSSMKLYSAAHTNKRHLNNLKDESKLGNGIYESIG